MKKIALAALMLAASFHASAGAGYDSLNVGIQYANDGAWDNAVIWLDKAITAGDLLPDQMRVARYNRAKAYAGSGRPNAAISDFTAVLALTPDDVQVRTERAFAYIADGQGDQALADLRSAHAKRPKNVRINFLTGLVNWTLGRPEDASTAFADALKEGKSRYAWLWLKLSDLKQKKETSNYRTTYLSDAWPKAVIDLYSGDRDETAVLNNVKDYGDTENCEAIFYIAEWRLIHDDTAGAKPMLQKAINDCPKGNVEPLMAQLELGNLP